MEKREIKQIADYIKDLEEGLGTWDYRGQSMLGGGRIYLWNCGGQSLGWCGESASRIQTRPQKDSLIERGPKERKKPCKSKSNTQC